MNKRKRIETSKKVLGAVLTFCLVYLALILVGWFMGKEDATGLAGVIAGMVTLIVGSYYVKAAKENLNKYGRKDDDETFI